MRQGISRIISVVLLIGAFGLMVGGCSEPAAVPGKPAAYDLGVGLFGPGQATSGAAASLRYSVDASGIFSADYVIDAQTGGQKLMVIALDNGKQVDFTLNGVTGPTHLIVALTGSHKFPVAFGPLKAGLHNIVVLAIADPDNHRLDAEWRAGTEALSYPTKAVSLSVGKSTEAEKPAAASAGKSVPDSDFGNVALASSDTMRLTAWTQQKVKPGAVINAFVHLGNPSTVAIPYTLSILLAGRQTPIAPGVSAVSGTMVAGRRLILPVTLTAPDEPGTYELMAVAGINPFVQQPKTTSSKNISFYFGSARTALIVE